MEVQLVVVVLLQQEPMELPLPGGCHCSTDHPNALPPLAAYHLHLDATTLQLPCFLQRSLVGVAVERELQ
jgi:hypothetical protein